MLANGAKTEREGLLLPIEYGEMVSELVRRLDSHDYVERAAHKSRRSDGSITIMFGENTGHGRLQIRLNAYSLAQSAVLELQTRPDQVRAVSLMVRPRAMGGDDRSEVVIPQRIGGEAFAKVGNIITAACVCVGRGQVEAMPTPQGVRRASFEIFLPSSNPLPHFDAEYRVIGLSSLY